MLNTPTDITCTINALKYLQLHFSPVFSSIFCIYLVNCAFQNEQHHTQNTLTRNSTYESKKSKHRNKNNITQNTMSHIGFRNHTIIVYQDIRRATRHIQYLLKSASSLNSLSSWPMFIFTFVCKHEQQHHNVLP